MPGSGRARWGWYRLDDPFARQLVELSGVGARELVLDLGAGDGVICRHLAECGARTIAFELHPGRADALRRRFAPQQVKVVRADIADLRLPTRAFRVVANPPFGVISPLLDRLTSRASLLERADLVVPLAVAERWVQRLARSPWQARIERRLPRHAFEPRPRIDCCVMTITRRNAARVSRRGAGADGR